MSMEYYGNEVAVPGAYDYGNYHKRQWEDESRGRERDRKKRTFSRGKKKTRWAEKDSTRPIITSSLSAIPFVLCGSLSIEQQEALLVRIRIEEITKKLSLNDLDLDYTEERRSPSPEPIYDEKGKRVNTRDQRAKDNLNSERSDLVDIALMMNPQFKPPADYTPSSSKKMRKIYIPIDKYPDYNFIGLIIGPRGNTQKRMEKETGCKIAIRGKGSVKEGKIKRDGPPEPGADDKLHVLVTADNEIQLEKASKMIQQLLVPMEEGKNEHKRQQLRELAEINGTLRDRWWMHPETSSNWERASVKCAICGDASHPTSDCSLRGKGPLVLPPAQQQQMDSEYQKFLTEIGEELLVPSSSSSAPSAAPTPSAATSTTDAYAEFMAAIGEATSSHSQPQQQQQQQQQQPAAPPSQLHQAPSQQPPQSTEQNPWAAGYQMPGAAPWAQQQQPPQQPPWGTYYPGYAAGAPWQQGQPQ